MLWKVVGAFSLSKEKLFRLKMNQKLGFKPRSLGRKNLCFNLDGNSELVLDVALDDIREAANDEDTVGTTEH
jgi:hypothetical protein